MYNDTKVNLHEDLAAPLDQFTSHDLEQVGGKGANLGELINAGFHVPHGFVVTTAAYDSFVEDNHLDKTILAAIQPAESASTTIRAAFESAPLPVEVERAILDAYRQLARGAVAVRSSATAEDLPQAAFAGQQDTYLNVLGEQPLLEAVRRCWGSLWSERAISYRIRQGIDQRTVKLAVVVQDMVAAEAAGVMFTANPVSGARDEIIVDANPGLGEAVVSGLVTPDHFVLRQNSRLHITERRPGRREVIIQAQPEGGTRQVRGGASGGFPTLSDRLLLQLARTGLDIQRHFGVPQDIEWAVANGDVYILQARPITALPEPFPPTNRMVQMLSAMFTEMFPVRPYPLDQTTWIPAISAAAVDPLFGLIGISVPHIQHFFIEEDGVVVRFSGKLDMGPTPALLLAPARLLLLSLRYDPIRFQSDPLLIRARQEAQRLEALDLQAMSWPALLDLVRKALSLALPLAGEIRRRYYPRALLALGLLRAALGVMGLGNLFGMLISAPESTTVEANQALEALAERVRSDSQLARLFQSYPPDRLIGVLLQQPVGKELLAQFNSFLERFGHREVVLSSVLHPTWKGDPALVLGMIQGMAQAKPSQVNVEQGWESARNQLLAHPLMRLSPLRRFMLYLVATGRSLWQVREDTHFDATRIMPILRRTFLELGRRLVSASVIAAPEEVFHLKFDDLQRIDGTWPPDPELVKELRSFVQRRRAKRSSLEKIPLIDPRLYQPANPDHNALLTGTPGSPGVAEGPVRVINSVSEFGRLQPGDVLVAPYTNPAWTPLFQRAAAVVVDSGAAGSHAAIVAREYGLPAVMGTVEATRRLTDGQRVRVDGSRGLVFAAGNPPEKPG